MQNLEDQIRIYRKSSRARNEARPLVVSKASRQYFRNFLKSNKKVVKSILIGLFLVSMIEILVPLSAKFLERSIYRFEIFDYALQFAIIFIVLIIYLILSYENTRLKSLLSINFINQIRRDWLRKILGKNVSDFRNSDLGNLMVKITYHFSLLRMGINNCIFGLVEWIILTFAVVAASFFIDTNLFIVSLGLILFNIIVAYVGYIVSYYYLAPDQTLYSKLLRYIADTFSNFSYHKNRGDEVEFMKKVNHIVELDTYFRVRREIFLSYGNNIIFSVLIVFSMAFLLFELYEPIFNFKGGISTIVYGFVFVLMIRLIYLSLRIGLYSFPLKLGFFLAVPSRNYSLMQISEIEEINKLEIRSKKVKLNPQNEKYQKNISFNFSGGNLYNVISTDPFSRKYFKSVLRSTAKNYLGKPWTIKLNGKWRNYLSWMKTRKNIFEIGLDVSDHAPFLDFLNSLSSKKGSEKITKKIEDINKFLERNGGAQDVFGFILQSPRFLGEKISRNKYSSSEKVLLNILFATLNKPDIVIIDLDLMDVNDQKLLLALKILKRELNDKIIIVISEKIHEGISYDRTYQI